MLDDVHRFLKSSYQLVLHPVPLVRALRSGDVPLWQPISFVLLITAGLNVISSVANIPPARLTADVLFYAMISDTSLNPALTGKSNQTFAEDLLDELRLPEGSSEKCPKGRFANASRSLLERSWATPEGLSHDALRGDIWPGFSRLQFFLDENTCVRYADELEKFVQRHEPAAFVYISGLRASLETSTKRDDFAQEALLVVLVMIFGILVFALSFKALSVKASIGLSCYLFSVATVSSSLPQMLLALTPYSLWVGYPVAMFVQLIVVEAWLIQVVPRALELPRLRIAVVCNVAYIILMFGTVVFLRCLGFRVGSA